MPFIPLRVTGPRGPIDPPLFSSEAPPGWWESSAETLHHAAVCISDILQELDKANQALASPFAGFCAFSAAIILCYDDAFPHMNLGRSVGAGERAERCIQYLKHFGTKWNIGQEWVSCIVIHIIHF